MDFATAAVVLAVAAPVGYAAATSIVVIGNTSYGATGAVDIERQLIPVEGEQPSQTVRTSEVSITPSQTVETEPELVTPLRANLGPAGCWTAPQPSRTLPVEKRSGHCMPSPLTGSCCR